MAGLAPAGHVVGCVGRGARVLRAAWDGGLGGRAAAAAVEEGADFAVGRVPVDHGGAAEGNGCRRGAARKVGFGSREGGEGCDDEGGTHFDG